MGKHSHLSQYLGGCAVFPWVWGFGLLTLIAQIKQHTQDLIQSLQLSSKIVHCSEGLKDILV